MPIEEFHEIDFTKDISKSFQKMSFIIGSVPILIVITAVLYIYTRLFVGEKKFDNFFRNFIDKYINRKYLGYIMICVMYSFFGFAGLSTICIILSLIFR